jgi:hypothetical protein
MKCCAVGLLVLLVLSVLVLLPFRSVSPTPSRAIAGKIRSKQSQRESVSACTHRRERERGNIVCKRWLRKIVMQNEMVQSLVEKSRQLSIQSTGGGLSVTRQDRYKIDMRLSSLYICN